MTDLDLWKRLKAGDRRALERIYREHAALLLRYGGKFAVSEPLVEDCIQDLFVNLWRRRSHLSDTDSIRRYLMVALRRRIIQQLDRRRKRFSDDDPAEHDFQVELAHDQLIIAEELSEERSTELRAAFQQLSKRQREIVYLKYFAGFDYEDIGTIMGLNYQSARNLLSRALKKLKDVLPAFFLVIFWIFFLPK
jgi:RNA polymerase sigma factor (sigma-70 family)